jgi:hypothetical protein
VSTAPLVGEAELVAFGVLQDGPRVELTDHRRALCGQPIDLRLPVGDLDVQVNAVLRGLALPDLLEEQGRSRRVDCDRRIGCRGEPQRGESCDLGVVVGAPRSLPTQLATVTA